MNIWDEGYNEWVKDMRFCGYHYHWDYAPKTEYHSRDWFCDACMKKAGAWNMLQEGRIR